MGEWTEQICEQAGIGSSEADRPYFANVPAGSSYYDAVQSSVDWGILKEDQTFDPDEQLNRGWAAATMVRLMDLSPSHSEEKISDISDSQFQEEIKTAVENGLIRPDPLHHFHADKVMNRREADALLAKAVNAINDPDITTKSQLQFSSGGTLISEHPSTIDPQSQTAYFDHSVSASKGDVFIDSSSDQWYSIESVQANGTEVTCQPMDPMSSEVGIDMEGSADLSFDEAEIISGPHVEEADVSQGSALSAHGSDLFLSRQKTFHAGDYEIKLIWSGQNLSAKVTKTTPQGLKIYAGAMVNGIQVKYKWKNSQSGNSFFKVSFHSSENIGASISDSRTYYPDLSRVKAVNFLKSLSEASRNQEKQEAVINLCTVDFPVAGTPVKVRLSLKLNLYASGKAEISFGQDCTLGAEVRNGCTRMIHEFSHDEEAVIRANTGIGSEINAALTLADASLMDVGLEGGIKGNCDVTVHLFDQNGDISSSTVEVNPDTAEASSEKNDHVLVCSDIKAYQSLRLKTNSRKTLLGKLGLGKNIDLADENNNTLIPSFSGHYESGQKVDRCTRNNRVILPEAEKIKADTGIGLEQYALAVHPGKSIQIQITSLPDGYDTSSLRYTSDDSSVALVDSNGIVSPVHQGNTIIKIQTADGKYEVNCSVLVTEK